MFRNYSDQLIRILHRFNAILNLHEEILWSKEYIWEYTNSTIRKKFVCIEIKARLKTRLSGNPTKIQMSDESKFHLETLPIAER